MPRIFLSHASRDNRQAVALAQWLSDQRPELAQEIFLDISEHTGLRPGQCWKDALRRANDRCEAVICLPSQDWQDSPECGTEYRVGETLGKQILVGRLEDIAVSGGPPVQFSSAARDHLKKAIEGTGTAPEHFEWPPKSDPGRAPDRGWEPFEDIDAGVFFGRDAAIVLGMDGLRKMRLEERKPPFVAHVGGPHLPIPPDDELAAHSPEWKEHA